MVNKYILINHGTGASEGWEQYFAMLHEQGHMVGGSALNHGLSVKDGVFSVWNGQQAW